MEQTGKSFMEAIITMYFFFEFSDIKVFIILTKLGFQITFNGVRNFWPRQTFNQIKNLELLIWDFYFDFNSRVSNSRFLSWLKFSG